MGGECLVHPSILGQDGQRGGERCIAAAVEIGATPGMQGAAVAPAAPAAAGGGSIPGGHPGGGFARGVFARPGEYMPA